MEEQVINVGTASPSKAINLWRCPNCNVYNNNKKNEVQICKNNNC